MFRETIILFGFVSCFAKQKKGCEMETLLNPQFEFVKLICPMGDFIDVTQWIFLVFFQGFIVYKYTPSLRLYNI
jgi:hypothetical protein